jgi:hypothetical protein
MIPHVTLVLLGEARVALIKLVETNPDSECRVMIIAARGGWCMRLGCDRLGKCSRWMAVGVALLLGSNRVPCSPSSGMLIWTGPA